MYFLTTTMALINIFLLLLALSLSWNESFSQGTLQIDNHISIPQQRFPSPARFGGMKDSSSLIITKYSSFVVDSLQRINIGAILRQFHHQPSQESVPTIQFHDAHGESMENLGYVFPAVWIRFSIRRVLGDTVLQPLSQNKTEIQRQNWRYFEPYLLSLGNRDADSVELYIVLHDTLVYADTVGFSVAYNKWKVPAPQIVFALPPECNSGDECICYVRFRVRDIFLYSIKLRTREAFITDEFEFLKRYLVFFGIALFAILFNLLVWISTRSRYHAIYIAYITCESLWLIITSGFWHQLFRVTTPSLYTAFDNTAWALSMILGVLFITNLVQEQKSIYIHKFWYRAEYLFYALCVLGVILRISKLDRYIDILPYSYLLLAVPLTLGISYRAWRQGYSPALYLLIARIAIEVGLGWNILATLGFVPFSSLLINQLALLLPAIEMIFLGFALAERLTFLQKTKLEAERKAFEGEKYRLQNEELSSANKEITRQQSEIMQQAAEIQEMNAQVTELNISLQQQNHDLAEANREKNEIMGIVAHDLKNPIGGVRGMAELIESVFADDRTQTTSAARQIIQTSERMLELVSKLLDINKLESGEFAMDCYAFDIVPIISMIIEQYAAPAVAKNITFHTELPATSRSIVFANEQAVMQALENIISNAVKYSPHGKNVYVRVKNIVASLPNEADGSVANNASSFVRVEVEDEGPGFTEEDKTKLFGKFARLSAQPTGGEHSTGLGLSIVKRMVEAMNGEVWCESERGQGATFIVQLPTSISEASYS